jgi:hypothetical protein
MAASGRIVVTIAWLGGGMYDGTKLRPGPANFCSSNFFYVCALLIALMMEVACTSEISVKCETAWRNIPEGGHFHVHHHEYLKSHDVKVSVLSKVQELKEMRDMWCVRTYFLWNT